MKSQKIKNSYEVIKADKKGLTRKQAIQKAGLMTLTTASMLLLMKSPAKAAASAPAPPPAW